MLGAELEQAGTHVCARVLVFCMVSKHAKVASRPRCLVTARVCRTEWVVLCRASWWWLLVGCFEVALV